MPRFSYDAGQLYQAIDLDGGGELTLEEIDPRADELYVPRLKFELGVSQNLRGS